IGWRLGGGSRSWDGDSPVLIKALCEAAAGAVSFLAQADSPRGVANAAMTLKNRSDPYVQQAIAYSLARAGEVEAASQELDNLVPLLHEDVPWQREMARRARILRAQLSEGGCEAARSFDTWTKQTSERLRVTDESH